MWVPQGSVPGPIKFCLYLLPLGAILRYHNISSVCRSTHFHLRNIGRIRHLHATAQLIHALISIRLDYCNSVLYNLPKNSILRLQRIQNQAARILTKTPRRDHITEVLIDLHWLKIEERIVYQLLILTFTAFIYRTAPLYLCELNEQQKGSTNTRLSNDAFLLKLHPPSRNCSDTFLGDPLLMEPHMNGTSLMNVSDGCPTLTCLKLRRCYFYVISTVSMLLVIIIIN